MTRVVLPKGSPLVVTFGVLASLLAPVIVLTGSAPSKGLAVVVTFLMIAVPVGVGIHAQRTEATRRFGRQLVLIGCGLAVTTLAYSSSDALYTLARLVGWCMEVALIYVLCAYPTGRLEGRAERVVVAAGGLVVGLLFLPTAFVAEFPLPSAWTTCVDSCPTNILSDGTAPSVVTGFVEPLRGVLSIAVFIAAAFLIARRVRHASPLARTSLSPVLGVAVVRFASEGAFVVLRGSGVSDQVLVPVALMIDLTIPLVALGFLIGLLRWRLRVASALERLNERLGDAVDAAALQQTLRLCLEDPQLRLYLPAGDRPDRWRDPGGADLERGADPARGRTICPVEDGAAPVALICCDVAICEQRSLRDGIRAAVLSFLERTRLTEALGATLAEVDASRTRIAAAADATRRRIERDLHDGTQQRLIALRIRLELIEAEMTADPDRAQEMLHAIGPEVEAVIAEVRDLSRGIYPPLLADAGPVAALRGVAASLPVAARVDGDLSRREDEVEAAIYFCCVEAVQNAIKHGRGVGAITVSFSEAGSDACFEITDDGGGFVAEQAPGSGITNMHDRLAAIGGSLTVTSSDSGVRVRGVFPGRPAAARVRV